MCSTVIPTWDGTQWGELQTDHYLDGYRVEILEIAT